MKKIIALLSIVLLTSFGATPASAEVEHSIAVIDTGFDLDGFEDNIVAEACVIDKRTGCNNRSGLDVSPGASQKTKRVASRYQSDWDHGSDMVRAILSENPEANIVTVRNSAVIGSLVIPGGESDLVKALGWVLDNAERYNIVAVSFSRGDHKYVSKNRDLLRARATVKSMQSLVDTLTSRGASESRLAIYKSKLQKAIDKEQAIVVPCSASAELSSSVSELLLAGIPVIVATGNDSDKRFVDSPACIEDSISVTASEDSDKILSIANVSSTTDFAVVAPNTSTATAKLAGIWSRVYNGSYNSTYEIITNSGVKSLGLTPLLVG
jgi:hypothetical protein